MTGGLITEFLAAIGGGVLGRLIALSIQLCVVGAAASEQGGDR